MCLGGWMKIADLDLVINDMAIFPIYFLIATKGQFISELFPMKVPVCMLSTFRLVEIEKTQTFSCRNNCYYRGFLPNVTFGPGEKSH